MATEHIYSRSLQDVARSIDRKGRGRKEVIYLIPRRPSAPDAESAFWVGRLAPRCDFLVRMSNFVYILHTNHVAIQKLPPSTTYAITPAAPISHQ